MLQMAGMEKPNKRCGNFDVNEKIEWKRQGAVALVLDLAKALASLWSGLGNTLQLPKQAFVSALLSFRPPEGTV